MIDPTAKLCTFKQVSERIDGLANHQCTQCDRMAWRNRSEPEKVYAACRSPTASSPTLLGMMAGAANAAAGFVASGGKHLLGPEREARLSICRECPAYEPTLGRCDECGCFVSLKSWLPKEKCPLNKWP